MDQRVHHMKCSIFLTQRFDTLKNYNQLGSRLVDLLNLSVAPLAISFSNSKSEELSNYEADYPEKTSDGRTGAVSAGCVFWMKGVNRTFATSPADHGNCSVGSLTHGLKTLDEVASNADVEAVCEAGWVTPEIFPHIPVVKTRYKSIIYGPLQEATIVPDVILLRVIAKQVMQIQAAVQGLLFEGKPQCHIVPLAKENNEIAVSTGCMLSRSRTGMKNDELTCAIPEGRLEEFLDALEKVISADSMVASYAASDAKRFA